MIDPALPLIDLHRHLDGNVRLETILDLGRKHRLPLPAWEVDSLRPYVQVVDPQPGVMAFISRFKWMVGVLGDYEACFRVAYENVVDAQAEGIDYVELRFSPGFMAEPHQLDPSGVVEAVVNGIEQASSDIGMQVKLIGIISRTYGPEVAWRELQALLAYRNHLVGLDLAGDEAKFPGDLFVKHLQRGRDAGWKITVHAGEAAGAESVWQAIQKLGAVRVGHAVRALDDPKLIEYMREHRTGIETNLTSNVQTSIVPDYASHPLLQFMKQGLIATINTDDPGISGIDLRFEYEVAAPAAGLNQLQIHQLQRNAVEAAFLTPDERERLLESKRSSPNAEA